MGIGDNLMASGMARGAASRGRKVQFGDGARVIWDHHSPIIFRGNPNIAPQHGTQAGVEWIRFYKGSRIYNRQDGNRWAWNYDFRPTPGEIFLSPDEKKFGERVGCGFVAIEPNLPPQKTSSANKRWPTERYDEVARKLSEAGAEVIQMIWGSGHRIKGARHVVAPNFRFAMSVLRQAALYIGPEGGLHHASAAVDIPAVVLFGGFIPPQVTGYPSHTNLTGGAEACGSLKPCEHCREAMMRIGVDEVVTASLAYLRDAA